MKVVILGGSGTIGSAVAWDLVPDSDVERVGLVAVGGDRLERVRAWLASPKVSCHPVATDRREPLVPLLEQYDVAVLALPDRGTDYFYVEQVVAAGLSCVDVIEDYHRRPEPYETEHLQVPPGLTLDEYGERLHERAVANGVTILDGIGFAPGLSNVTVGHAIRQMDEADSAVARVGGIPTREAAARHPLGYVITWDFAHVLREYSVRLKVVRAGRVVETEAGSDVEPVRFAALGRDEALEGATTAGMPSFPYTRPG